MSNGVKQGGILSPKLFTIYIDELFNELESAGLGCYFNNQYYGILGYADDLTLLAPSKCHAIAMLEICSRFAERFQINFNSSKSQLLVFDPGGIVNKDDSIVFNGTELTPCGSATYLGFTVSAPVINVEIANGINDISAKCVTICNTFKYLSYDVRFNLFKSFACSLYGCQLWSYQGKEFERFVINWRKCTRKIMNVPARTHCILLPFMSDCLPIDCIVYTRFLMFLRACVKSPNCKVSTIANFVCDNHSNLVNITSKLNLSKNNVRNLTNMEIRSEIEEYFFKTVASNDKIYCLEYLELLECALADRDY